MMTMTESSKFVSRPSAVFSPAHGHTIHTSNTMRSPQSRSKATEIRRQLHSQVDAFLRDSSNTDVTPLISHNNNKKKKQSNKHKHKNIKAIPLVVVNADGLESGPKLVRPCAIPHVVEKACAGSRRRRAGPSHKARSLTLDIGTLASELALAHTPASSTRPSASVAAQPRAVDSEDEGESVCVQHGESGQRSRQHVLLSSFVAPAIREDAEEIVAALEQMGVDVCLAVAAIAEHGARTLDEALNAVAHMQREILDAQATSSSSSSSSSATTSSSPMSASSSVVVNAPPAA